MSGPFVFPIRDANEHPGPMGITLRDWFAGQALAGLSSATGGAGDWTSEPESTAMSAYQYADAMLAERSK